jgi:hypothetical protein
MPSFTIISDCGIKLIVSIDVADVERLCEGKFDITIVQFLESNDGPLAQVKNARNTVDAKRVKYGPFTTVTL